jgi:glycosyltransferase involved in cell wall biosynthesis
MRILSFTAGAASMYCGSCLRDNNLARELLRRGHDVTLVPVYTPTLTDEQNVSRGRVAFGGISVYLQHYAPAFRRTPALLDRLWDSRWALRAASRRSIPVDPRLLGELTVSMLEGESGPQHKEFLKLLGWLAREAPPDIVTLPNSLLIAMAAPLKRLFARPVLCTLQGEDLFLDGLIEPYRARALELLRRHLDTVDGFVAVSEFGARMMSGLLGIAPERVHVVPLGVSVEDRPLAARRVTPPYTIGYFARIAPEKGLHLLADAFALLRRDRSVPPSRLAAGGYLAAGHQPYLAAIQCKLGDGFVYHGALDRPEKLRFLESVDVFCAPSTYAEPKGLYLLEAMAAGVPVVAPAHGAFPEMVDSTGGGLLFTPGSAEDLARQVAVLLADREYAATLGENGAVGVRGRYTVAHMADRTLEVYGSIVARPLAAR